MTPIRKTLHAYIWILALSLHILCFSEENTKTTYIQFDANEVSGELKPFWSSQKWHPTEYLLTPWGDDLLELMHEAGAAMRYIRIYNQPENAIRVSDSGEISYDWSDFDAMAHKILSTGAKPIVVFFGMPQQLASIPEAIKRRNYGRQMNISPPADFWQWEQLCYDFTRHIVKTFGEEEVKQWYIRCWNEPDLRGFWYQEDIEAYNELYDYFAHGVKRAFPLARIGGGGYSSTKTYLNPDQLRLFFDHVTSGKNHVTGEIGSPIDYLSLHIYGGSGGAGGPGREYPSVDYLISAQEKYYAVLEDYPKLQQLPFYLDEWGTTASGTRTMESEPKAVVRNTEYSPAFMTELVIRQLDRELKGLPRFDSMSFCISGYENPNRGDFLGTRVFHTRSGYHLPILNGYRMLAKLGDQLVGVSKPENNAVWALAARSEKGVQILIVNFQEDQIEVTKPPEKIELMIETGLEEIAEVTHWRIDHKYSNAYTKYLELGAPEFPNPLEDAAIREAMTLKSIPTENSAISGSRFSIQFKLPPNGISLIEIQAKQ